MRACRNNNGHSKHLHNRASTTKKHTATAESLWSSEQARRWESASEPRPRCRRPARAQQGIEHLVEEELVNPCGPTNSLDHGTSLCVTTGTARPATNGIDNRFDAQLGSLHGRKDHGNRTVHHEEKVDDLDGLQLRRLHSFLQCEPKTPP